MIFYIPCTVEETLSSSSLQRDKKTLVNHSFLDSELKKENRFLLSYENIKSNKCHPTEIDFSSPKWYSLVLWCYCRQEQFQESKDCTFSSYKG